MAIRSFVAGACLLFALPVLAQTALDNNAVVKMVKAGLGNDVIIAMVQSQPGNYQLSPDSLAAMKQAGVSDAVLAAMAGKASGPANTAPAPDNNSYDDLDIGVYQNVGGQWVQVPTEQVNWKTGGFMKSIATDGIVKGDINGHLNGGTSRTVLHGDYQFLIVAPEGDEATDFELVRMHAKENQREFRTVTGGVFHASGGASRDAVEFEQKRLARHVYSVMLPHDIGKGEYAFLAPGLSNSTAGGSVGKAYTFEIPE